MNAPRRRVLCCVATEFGAQVLRGIVEAKLELELVVSTFDETNVVEAAADGIRSYARERDIPLVRWREIREGAAAWLQRERIWALVCSGWRYMITDEMRAAVEDRVLVTHQSLLPRYRGFAPIPTALINGESEVGGTVILAAADVDAGDVVYQARVPVGPQDTSATLVRRIAPHFVEGVTRGLRGLLDGNLATTPQDQDAATYSVWRDPEDLWIDWRESADRIERTVRALGPPYQGARTRLNEEVVIVHEAAVVDDLAFELRQPGKVWRLTPSGAPVVICGKGMLALTRATDTDGVSVLPLRRLRSRLSSPQTSAPPPTEVRR